MPNSQKKITKIQRSGKDLILDDVLIGNCPLRASFGDAWISKLKECKTWTEWCSLTANFEQAWHSSLNLKNTSHIVNGGRHLRKS